MTSNWLRLPDLQRLRRLQDLPYVQRLRRLQDLPYVQRLRRLPRRHRMVAAGAFTVVGVLVGPTAAMAAPASGPNPPVVTEHAASLAAASLVGSLGQPSVTVQMTSPSTAAPAEAASGSGTAEASIGSGTVAAHAAAPAAAQLHPVRITAAQQTFRPTATQLRNAKSIVDAGQAMGLPPRAWVIAVATSIQESNLRNLGNLGSANDHDSLGLFQQRPSSGWGTAAQVQDPTYAATAFYEALVRVPGWDRLPLTTAAQKVQVSAYPRAYAKHEIQAGNLIDAFYGVGPYADLAAGLRY